MSLLHRTQHRVEFAHTDAAGIAHFSAFFGYMEEAEHEMLRARGLSVLVRDEQGPVSWPRVSARCDYSGAVRFEDVLDVEVRLKRLGTTSVTYAFRFSHEGRAVASGEMTSVCCRIEPEHPPKAIPIPAGVVARLKKPIGD